MISRSPPCPTGESRCGTGRSSNRIHEIAAEAADCAGGGAPERRTFEPFRIRKADRPRSEEHTSELQSLMRISYAVFCLKKKKNNTTYLNTNINRTKTHKRK